VSDVGDPEDVADRDGAIEDVGWVADPDETIQ